jgi:hypothetical protein
MPMMIAACCAAVLFALCAAVWLVRRRAGRWERHRGRKFRRGPSAFDARAWPDGRGAPPPDVYHRPAEIDLTDTGILPPPRQIRGRYGE